PDRETEAQEREGEGGAGTQGRGRAAGEEARGGARLAPRSFDLARGIGTPPWREAGSERPQDRREAAAQGLDRGGLRTLGTSRDARDALLEDPKGREESALQDQSHERRAPLSRRADDPEELELREDRGLAPENARDLPGLPEFHPKDHEPEAGDAGSETRTRAQAPRAARALAMVGTIRRRAAEGPRHARGVGKTRGVVAWRARRAPEAEPARPSPGRRTRASPAGVPSCHSEGPASMHSAGRSGSFAPQLGRASASG